MHELVESLPNSAGTKPRASGLSSRTSSMPRTLWRPARSTWEEPSWVSAARGLQVRSRLGSVPAARGDEFTRSRQL